MAYIKRSQTRPSLFENDRQHETQQCYNTTNVSNIPRRVYGSVEFVYRCTILGILISLIFQTSLHGEGGLDQKCNLLHQMQHHARAMYKLQSVAFDHDKQTGDICDIAQVALTNHSQVNQLVRASRGVSNNTLVNKQRVLRKLTLNRHQMRSIIHALGEMCSPNPLICPQMSWERRQYLQTEFNLYVKLDRSSHRMIKCTFRNAPVDPQMMVVHMDCEDMYYILNFNERNT